MTPQSKRAKLLILRIASCFVSGCAAIMIFAISLPAYAEALAEWGQGNSYGQTLLLGLFLSVPAIGLVIIQTNFEHARARFSSLALLLAGWDQSHWLSLPSALLIPSLAFSIYPTLSRRLSSPLPPLSLPGDWGAFSAS